MLFRSFIEMIILPKNLINFENYLVWEIILDTLSRSHHTIYDTRLGFVKVKVRFRLGLG